MLYAFGFERVGVLFSDMYVLIPDPLPGQEGAERGVRLEVRLLERGELRGSMFSSRPIEVGRGLARGPAGVGRRAAGQPGPGAPSPELPRLGPGRRAFDPELTGDPVQFVGERLADLEGLLERAGVATDEVTAADAKSLRACLPEVMDAVGRLLKKAQHGETAAAPGGEPSAGARVGWL